MSTATIQLRAESRQIRTATDDLRALERQGSATDRTAQILTRTLGALGAALSVRQLTEYTNTWTDLNSRILNVTKDGKLAAEVMQSISDTADRTYSSLTDTAEAFLANAATLTELGYTTQQQIKLSEALNNALVVSGTKGQAAASVMDALSKSFATGELRGENFNSVIARGGRIVEALAEGLGVGTLELRKMASEGQLTTQKVFEALTSQAEKLAAEADAMAATVGDGFVRIGNAALQTVGRFDQLTGASSSVAGVLVSISESIKNIDDENLVRAAAAMDLLLKAGVAVAAVYGARVVGAAGSAAVAMGSAALASRAAAVSYDAMGVAVTRATAAMSAGAVAARGLGAAITLIGGPLGFVALTGAAVAYTIYDMRKAQDEFAEATSRSTAAIQAQNSVLDIYQQKTKTAAQESLKGLGINELNAEFDKANNLIAIYSKRLESLTSRGASAQRIADVNEKLRLQRERLDAIKEALPGVIGLSAQQQQALEKVTTSLTDQIYELEKGRDAYELLIATRQAGVALDSAEAAGLQSMINRRNQLRKSIEDEAKAREEAQRIERESQSRVDSLRQGIVRDIQSGMSPLQQLEAELYQRQQIIERFRQEGTLNTASADQLELDALVAFNLRKNEIEQQAAEERRRIRENEESLRRQQMMTTLSATESLFGNLADIAKDGGKKSFESYKILASAQAGVSGVMAYMNALATPAPFPIPQILAGTIAAVTAVQIAKLNSMQYSGARRQGGQVTRGNSYLVGEQGPEMITMGGNGRVTPFNQLIQKAESGGGGSSQVNLMVNISKQEGAQDSVTGRQVQDKYILDVVVGSMDSRGAVFNSVVRNTTAQGRTR